MHAQLPPGHPAHKLFDNEDAEDAAIFKGVWKGPAMIYDGVSRQGMSSIIDLRGTIIWTQERHPFADGQRVRFRIAIDESGIEQQAVAVEAIEPVGVISKDAKIGARSK